MNTPTPRRRRALALLLGALATAVPVGLVSTGATAPAAGAQGTVTFTQSWTRQLAAGRAVSTSSPVLVDNGGTPFVVAGDNAGNLRAFDLASGNPLAGWNSVNVGVGLRAPLSSDGSNVYVPVATDGADRYPQFRKFAASGAPVWTSNPGTVLPSSPAVGFLLSGVALARVGANWSAFSGSSGQFVYGIDAASGAKAWEFRNADSTMATPALADLYGLGSPQVITSNDTTAEFPTDRNGGVLRIFTSDGRQICTASQFVEGNTYAASGYNNSSPVVGLVDGRPLIAFGSTGPVQYGAGGNQVVAYDAGCNLRWSSPPLDGQALSSPTMADVLNRGVSDIVQVVAQSDGANTYPRVYTINAQNGSLIADTGTRLRAYGAALAYPETLSIVTADLNSDGAQDLVVPAKQGAFVLLDGRNLALMGTINTNLVIQNTPIVTATTGGVRVTFAGYNGLGAQVSSYVANGATLGNRGWRSFGNNAQLTGVQGTIAGPYDQLLEGQTLGSGRALVNGGYRATMQGDGNLVVQDGGGRPVWFTGTSRPGSVLRVEGDGVLNLVAPDSSLQWFQPARGSGMERLVLGGDGVLRVASSSVLWATSRRLNTERTLWTGLRGVLPTDRILWGEVLMSGQELVSADGTSRAVMQTDGNLTVYRNGQLLWQSGTFDLTARGFLALQTDGNVVVFDHRPWPMREFGVANRGGRQLVIGNDGILRLVAADGGLVWSTAPRVK